ncbi:MAG: histidine kinase [Puia sp.]|nr:histidine kinase [Puia sp.]
MNTALKLLLLEDDPSDLELIRKFLHRSGLVFDATIATDKPEFLAAIQNDSFDAILADNSLPQFNSFDALKILQEEGADPVFILVTGTVSEEFAVDIIHMGADDYVLKNNLTRLPSAITRALEKRKIKREKLDAEAALVKSEEKYRLLFEENPLPAWVIDDQTNLFLAVNDAAVKHYGYSRDEFAGMPLSRIRPEGTAIARESGILNHMKKDGSFIDAEILSARIAYDGKPARLELINDLTQKLKAENEIKQVNRELHALSCHLQNIREEERIQIARDIHDELGQQLTGLKMDVYALNKQIKTDDKTIQGKFTDILVLIDETVNSVRRISAHLRPSILDDLGLVAALKWQNQEAESRFGIKINFVADQQEINAPAAIATGLFRIYQEALTNAVRHAQAHEIHSSLRITNDRLFLEIKDDGKGIDTDTTGKRKSFGLLGIKERVFVMEGQYELKSEPGKGTCISISVPI